MANILETRADVLRVLYEKWLQDHTGEKLRYPSKCCYWETSDGKRSRIPDDYFDECVERFSRPGVNECLDSLDVDGLIELFDTGLDVYYVVAPKGLAKMAELQRKAAVTESTMRFS
jgi:hypothetical protein